MLTGYIFGAILALFSASLFGANSVISRIVGLSLPTNIMVPATLIIGTILTLIGDLLLSPRQPLGWQVILIYAIAGVLNFAVARFFYYSAIKRIGASPTAVIVSGNVVITGILGSILINEKVEFVVWLGLLLFLVGSIISSGWESLKSLKNRVGLIMAFIATLIVALVNVIVRMAVKNGGDPIFGLFISYTSATLTYFALMHKQMYYGVKILLSRENKYVFFLGTIAVLAQLFRYASLSFLPAVKAAPIFSTSMFFSLIFLLFTEKAREKPGIRHGIGGLIAFTGIVIIYSL